MKLIQIQYFLTIAENKSITKAAEQLFVSQPALTKQMNLLEEELGVKLMQRHPSGIELTAVGEAFADDCRVVLKDLEKAIAKAVNAGKKEIGTLRIGCFDGAVVEDFLPALYAYLRKKAPGIQIKLGRHSFNENRRALENDSIDMLIELRFPAFQQDEYYKDCVVKTLIKREGALIYSENSPLAKKKLLKIKDFAKETFYALSAKQEEIPSQAGIETLEMLGIQNPNIEEVDNFATLISNVKMGFGYAALSKLAAESVPGLLAFDLPETRGVEVVAVWKKTNRHVSGLMKDFR